MLRLFSRQSIQRTLSNKGYSQTHHSVVKSFEGTTTPQFLKDEAFFPRERDSRFIENMLDGEPQGIISVLGPPNVGKTILLRNILKNRIVAHLDLRKQGLISSVDTFVRVLKNQFQSWDNSSLHVTESFKGMLGGAKILGFEIPKDRVEMDTTDFRRLVSCVDSLLIQIKALNLGTYPVFFIDDANKLKYLLQSDQGVKVLTAFFDWLVSASKADKLCHVIIASNSGNFIQWIEHEFGLTSHLRTVIIEDLEKAKAFRFLRQYINYLNAERSKLIGWSYDQNPHPPTSCEVKDPLASFPFDYVYDVLGGNMYCLRLFAQDYVHGIPIEACIDSLEQMNRRVIMDALRPEFFPSRHGKIGWTRGEWLAVLKIIASTRHGSIPYQKLLDTVFQDDYEGLQSLINNDLLSYRPSSPTSTEVDSHKPLVHVKSPVFLYSIRKVLKALPNPFIVLSVKNSSHSKFYRDVAVHPDNFNLLGLKSTIAHVWHRAPLDVETLVIEPEKELYREQDLNDLHSNQRLEVFFKEVVPSS
eukprot:TRINITY_DN23171_c0_g1_i1.p1 TRINITY_DN23171_c0_g1~~TRINITY_DN23171_c0_g1_i1.p1  ORF type:complete len:528 (-),score=112.20 TRINITY_DN23171_c0_g1_i1:41-1624(-)